MPATPQGRLERSGPAAEAGLLAAAIATFGARGYAATKVTDIVAAAGTGRNTFYRHFASRDDCMLAAIDFVVDTAGKAAIDAYRGCDGDWRDQLRAALDRILDLAAAHPAAARVYLIEAHVAGKEAIARAERLDQILERMLADGMSRSEEHEGMPAELLSAIVGGIRHVVASRAHPGRAGELSLLAPSLLEWALSYRPPRPTLPTPATIPIPISPVPAAGEGSRERMLQAITELIAEGGVGTLSISAVAARAQVSLSTFYKQFTGKDAALLAALAASEQRLLATTLSAYRAAPSWPVAVRDGLYAFCGFLALHPATTRMGGVGIFSGGPATLGWYDRSVQGYRALLEPGYDAYPAAPTIAADAIAGAIASAIHRQAREAGPERLCEIAPLATFIALSPFVGAAAAARLASS
jgi:AcrR family transcriptional regulator